MEKKTILISPKYERDYIDEVYANKLRRALEDSLGADKYNIVIVSTPIDAGIIDSDGGDLIMAEVHGEMVIEGSGLFKSIKEPKFPEDRIG